MLLGSGVHWSTCEDLLNRSGTWPVDIHSNMRWHDAEEASFMNYDLGMRVEKVDCSRISNCQFCDSKLTSCSPPGPLPNAH